MTLQTYPFFRRLYMSKQMNADFVRMKESETFEPPYSLTNKYHIPSHDNMINLYSKI